jgi:hypothetical protein
MKYRAVRFRWSLKVLLAVLLVLACLFGVMRALLRPENSGAVIVGTAITEQADAASDDVAAFDWVLMVGTGSKGALLVLRPCRGQRRPQGAALLDGDYEVSYDGMRVGGDQVFLPKTGWLVLIDEGDEISEVVPKTDRELSALRAVYSRHPTFEDLDCLFRSKTLFPGKVGTGNQTEGGSDGEQP